MINFCGLRKIVAQIIQFRIGRRDQVGIEPGMLNFAFPLVAEKLITRDKRQRDQSQDYRERPKQNRLVSWRNVDFKIGNCGKISSATEKCGRDELYRHRFERPIVEEIQRGKKD